MTSNTNNKNYHSDRSVFEKYIKDVQKYEVLSPERQKELVVKSQNGDEEARNLLVSSNLRFVMEIVKKYKYCGLTMQELISEGNLGLFEAIEKFDCTRQNNFISYAVWWIRYYITRLIHQSGKGIRVPMNKSRELLQIQKIEMDAQKDGESDKNKTDALVQDALRVSQEYVQTLKNASKGVVSLNQTIDTGNGGTVTEEDLLKDPKAEDPHVFASYTEELKMLEQFLAKIPKREAEVIRKHYGLGGIVPHSLNDLKKEFKLTKERIRQLKIKGIERMRAMVRSMNMLDAVAS